MGEGKENMPLTVEDGSKKLEETNSDEVNVDPSMKIIFIVMV